MVFRNTFFDTRYSVLGSRISVLIITIMLYGHLTPCPTFIEYHFELYYTIVYLVSHIPHLVSGIWHLISRIEYLTLILHYLYHNYSRQPQRSLRDDIEDRVTSTECREPSIEYQVPIPFYLIYVVLSSHISFQP